MSGTSIIKNLRFHGNKNLLAFLLFWCFECAIKIPDGCVRECDAQKIFLLCFFG